MVIKILKRYSFSLANKCLFMEKSHYTILKVIIRL